MADHGNPQPPAGLIYEDTGAAAALKMLEQPQPDPVAASRMN